MEKKKIVDLIKLEVLGCLSDEDIKSLESLKVEGNEFPWKELGDYQNLIARLPVSLEIKIPSIELKDKTAMKLYSIRDQIKAKIDAKKAIEVPLPPAEEISITAENIEEELTEQIEVEEKVLVEVEEGVQFESNESLSSKDENFGIVSDFKAKSESENLFHHTTTDIETKETPKLAVDKAMVEKIARDYLKSHLENDFDSLRSTINKNKMLSLVLFAITLILITALFIVK